MVEDDEKKRLAPEDAALMAPEPVVQSGQQTTTTQQQDQSTPFTTAPPDQTADSGIDYNPFVAPQSSQTAQTTLPDSTNFAPSTIVAQQPGRIETKYNREDFALPIEGDFGTPYGGDFSTAAPSPSLPSTQQQPAASQTFAPVQDFSSPKAPSPLDAKYADKLSLPITGDYDIAPSFGPEAFSKPSIGEYQPPTNLIAPGDTGISTMTGSEEIAPPPVPSTPIATTQPDQQAPPTSGSTSGSTSGGQTNQQPTIPQVFNPLWDYLAQQAQAERLREVPVPSSTNLSGAGTRSGLGRSIQKMMPTLENEANQLPPWLQQYLLMMQLGLVPESPLSA